jgi:microcin C transport system substrate-binding protein
VGQSNFDRIRVEYFADADVAFEAFTAGQYTFRQESSSLVWATRYDFPALDEGWVVRAELPNGNLPSAAGIVFNLREPKFQDRRVRQALALMFNFAFTNETLQYGLFEQRESFWQNSDLAAQGVPEGRELELLQSVADVLDPAVLTEPVTMPHPSSPESQLARGDLREALRLMEEAGWVAGADGALVKDGERFTVEILLDAPTIERVLTPYADNLRRLVGDDAVTVNVVDPAQYTQRERGFDWEIIYDGYVNYLEESSGLNQRYGSEGLGDLFNSAGFSHPAVGPADRGGRRRRQPRGDGGGRARHRPDPAARAVHRANLVQPGLLGRLLRHVRLSGAAAALRAGQLDFWWYDSERAAELEAAGAFD